MKSLTISPESYTGKDIEYIRDVLYDLIEEAHGISIDSMSFEINVDYTEAEDLD